MVTVRHESAGVEQRRAQLGAVGVDGRDGVGACERAGEDDEPVRCLGAARRGALPDQVRFDGPGGLLVAFWKTCTPSTG